MILRSMRMGLIGSMALLGACGGGEQATGDARSGDDIAVVKADPAKAAELASDADKARKRKKFDEARVLLRQADPIADVPVREEIRLVADRVDRDEAEALAADIIELAKAGECGKALDDTAALLRLPSKGSSFEQHARTFTFEPNLSCLAAMSEAGKLRDVKLLAGTKSASLALGPAGTKKLQTTIEEATTALVMKAIGEPLNEKRWADVVSGVRAVVARGDASPKDVGPAMDQVGKGLAAQLGELAAKAMGQPRGAAEALAEFDKLAAILWIPDGGKAPAAGGAAKLQPGPMPAPVAAQRKALAFWVTCSSVRCKETAPRKAWAYGNGPLAPVLEPKGKAAETLAHGTPFWEIATAPGLVLVAKADPGALDGTAARANVAWGWLRAKDVRAEDTSEWLPPGDALVGTRVWGPLRDSKERLLEIGTVVAIEKGQPKVRRMADREEVLVPRGRLLFGAVKPGARILAMCGGSLKPTAARVESVRETKFEAQGDPIVKLTCLDEKAQDTKEVRNDQLGSIRTKAEWLPRAR